MKLTNNNPYILQAMQDQELQGQQAMMQNIAAQQNNQSQAMAEANALTKQAAQPAPSAQPNMALAMALRKDKKKDIENANKEMAQFNQRPAVLNYSKGFNPMDIVSDE